MTSARRPSVCCRDHSAIAKTLAHHASSRPMSQFIAETMDDCAPASVYATGRRGLPRALGHGALVVSPVSGRAAATLRSSRLILGQAHSPHNGLITRRVGCFAHQPAPTRATSFASLYICRSQRPNRKSGPILAQSELTNSLPQLASHCLPELSLRISTTTRISITP